MSQVISIDNYRNINQPKDGKMTTSGTCQRKAVCAIINEHAVHKDGNFSLLIKDLPSEDKRILLSYTVNLDEFCWLTENYTRLNAAFIVYEREMQDLIDLYIDDCWHEAMQERGLTKHVDPINGEISYFK